MEARITETRVLFALALHMGWILDANVGDIRDTARVTLSQFMRALSNDVNGNPVTECTRTQKEWWIKMWRFEYSMPPMKKKDKITGAVDQEASFEVRKVLLKIGVIDETGKFIRTQRSAMIND